MFSLFKAMEKIERLYLVWLRAQLEVKRKLIHFLRGFLSYSDITFWLIRFRKDAALGCYDVIFYLLFEFGSLVFERFQRSQKFLDFNFSFASKALKSHNFHRMRGWRWVSAMKWVHSWFDCWEMQQGFTFDNADFWFSIFKSYLHSKSFTPMKVKKVCFC